MTDAPSYGNPYQRMPCGHLARFAVFAKGETTCLACEHDKALRELAQVRTEADDLRRALLDVVAANKRRLEGRR
jgi:hypothetical protein